MNGKQFVIATLIALVLLIVAFTPISSQQGVREYDAWCDINDDGKIDIRDIAYSAIKFGTTGTPINKTALLELDRRVRNIEEYVNEITKVEFLSQYATYWYYYGVSGHWNITKLQTEPFKERLNSTISGALQGCRTFAGMMFGTGWIDWKGYDYGVEIQAARELNPTEIEEVRLLIKEEYLAHL